MNSQTVTGIIIIVLATAMTICMYFLFCRKVDDLKDTNGYYDRDRSSRLGGGLDGRSQSSRFSGGAVGDNYS